MKLSANPRLLALAALASLLFAGTALAQPAAAPQAAPAAQATTAPAQADPRPRLYHFRGALLEVKDGAVSVQLEDGSTADFALAADARLRTPQQGPRATAADLAALPAGTSLRITATKGADGSLTATRVQAEGQRIKSEQPKTAPAAALRPSGLVTAYAPGASITIGSASYTLNAATRLLPAGHAADLAAGSRVLLLFGPNAADTGGSVWGIVVLPR